LKQRRGWHQACYHHISFSFLVVSVNKATTVSLLLSPIFFFLCLKQKWVMATTLLLLPFFSVGVATKKVTSTMVAFF
jgi:hypothetical protein